VFVEEVFVETVLPDAVLVETVLPDAVVGSWCGWVRSHWARRFGAAPAALSPARLPRRSAMPYIALPDEQPGIVGLLRYRPDTGAALNQLAEALLRGENTLTRAERELIAAHVSTLNECEYCATSHAAFAAAQHPGGAPFIEAARVDPDAAQVSPKLRALLRIAGAVRTSGRDVTPELIAAAREQGATDRELHDTVLIAAAFSLFNRYVDGLGTVLPKDAGYYEQSAKAIVEYGYAGATEQEIER
jgi:uncharacterized peroxidase-related enzyme